MCLLLPRRVESWLSLLPQLGTVHRGTETSESGKVFEQNLFVWVGYWLQKNMNTPIWHPDAQAITFHFTTLKSNHCLFQPCLLLILPWWGSLSLPLSAHSTSFAFYETAHFIKNLWGWTEIEHLPIIHCFVYTNSNAEYMILTCLLRIINVTGTGHS